MKQGFINTQSYKIVIVPFQVFLYILLRKQDGIERRI